jgi:integrase
MGTNLMTALHYADSYTATPDRCFRLVNKATAHGQPDHCPAPVAWHGVFGDGTGKPLALAKTETDLGRGTHVNPKLGKELLDVFAQDYFRTKTDWSVTTRQDRTGLWARHISPRFGQAMFKDLSTSAIRSWHATLYKQHATTAQGAYRLLRQVLNAAVTDGKLVRNPCKVKGAGIDSSPERSIATVAEVEVIVTELPERMRLMVPLAMWAGLRRSELQGLRRRDVDLVHRRVTVAETKHHLRGGLGVVTQGAKSRAGGRMVAVPSSIAADVESHLVHFVSPGRDALVFTGEQGGPLRPHVFGKEFRRARAVAGRPDLTFHDLRHTADTLAAATGATLPELMYRQGHATPHSAIRYLHATKQRDQVLAEALAELRPSAPVVDIGKVSPQVAHESDT